ncbi:EamA family transporter RarD [Streptococcus caprae]|uniref:EamA family transporter RarD n=1 Tax=Streptococcus caprae TaxID=1640501 RepID=A0ABV8CTF0_9STRE
MDKTKTGLLLGFICYLLWGVLSLYWKMLGHIDSYTVFSYRILFTVVTMLVYMLLSGKTKTYQAEFKMLWERKKWFGLMVAASFAIALNWLTFIAAVANGRAAQASLGYYIMPLVSICLSVLVLKEHITRTGKLAIGLAGLGVLLLVVQSGEVPLVSLTLAVSFGLYGLLKKGLPVSSDFAMLFEAGCVLVFSLPYLFWRGESFFSYSLQDMILLGLSGIITAIPLLLFAEGVKRAPLNLIGFIQYINPTIQLLIAVFVYGETVYQEQFPAFILIWLAIGVFIWGQISQMRKA